MSAMSPKPFLPTGNTVTIAATAASAATALGTPRAGNPEMPMTCRVVNGGTGLTFIKFGAASDVAALVGDTSMPLPANTATVFWVPAGATHIISIVAAAGTATVYATPGMGGG